MIEIKDRGERAKSTILLRDNCRKYIKLMKVYIIGLIL